MVEIPPRARRRVINALNDPFDDGYKPPGKIGKRAGKTLWITSRILVNMRTCIGKYAQPDLGFSSVLVNMRTCIGKYAQSDLGIKKAPEWGA